MKNLRNLKRLGLFFMALLLTVACGKKDHSKETGASEVSGPLHVISREEGSGTRGAFTEITGILVKNDAGEEVDETSEEVTIVNSTEAVVSSVNSDETAIGYISLGSLNDEVKAVKIDEIEISPESIHSGSYKIARPFILSTKNDEISEIGEDFLKFIMSKEGQEIVKEDGYVPLEGMKEYEPKNLKGRISIAGSTSVTPLMEKLVDAYKKLNPGFEADIQSNGSSAGLQAVEENIAEIGMSSRSLKEEEELVLDQLTIAMDGIAVIVNKENEMDNLTLDQVHDIFTGEITKWDEISK